MNRQLLQLLTWKVEQRLGRRLETPKDFEHLIAQLPQQDLLSMSTLKRVWNYVPSQHVPRENTLSILARFVGCNDWDDFCRQYDSASDSVFLTNVVKIADIQEGDELLLEWMPNRSCLVRKIADDTLLVVEAQNCKLITGDVFYTDWIAEGMPLCASNVQRNGLLLSDYIAGRRQGLKTVRKIRK
jgi:hypothetical protein